MHTSRPAAGTDVIMPPPPVSSVMHGAAAKERSLWRRYGQNRRKASVASVTKAFRGRFGSRSEPTEAMYHTAVINSVKRGPADVALSTPREG